MEPYLNASDVGAAIKYYLIREVSAHCLRIPAWPIQILTGQLLKIVLLKQIINFNLCRSLTMTLILLWWLSTTINWMKTLSLMMESMRECMEIITL